MDMPGDTRGRSEAWLEGQCLGADVKICDASGGEGAARHGRIAEQQYPDITTVVGA